MGIPSDLTKCFSILPIHPSIHLLTSLYFLFIRYYLSILEVATYSILIATQRLRYYNLPFYQQR